MARKYEVKQFAHLKGLTGISDGLLETHTKLYEGYVNRCNALTAQLEAMAKEGKAAGKDPIYAELTRRLGFEYDGVVLHELYFGNLKKGASAAPGEGKFREAISKSFGSYELWLADFKAIGTMPGIGWAVTFQDPATGWLSNHWITLHETNHPAGFAPILVMDGWEHAFIPDYKATERAKYVDAFFQNVDWAACEGRLLKELRPR